MAGRASVISTTAYIPASLTGLPTFFSNTGFKVTPGWTTLEGVNADLRLHERLGRAPTRVIEGYGEWELIERPKRRSITRWKGRTSLRVQSSIMFDGFKAGQSVESRIREFEQMAGLDIDQNGVERQPPLLMRFDNGPHDNNRASQNRWVIEKDIQWDLEEWNGEGQRIRAEATFVYLEYVSEQVYRQSGTQKNSKKQKSTTSVKGDYTASKKTSKSTHQVKHGETLVTIAADIFQDRNMWTAIASANGLRDPNSVRTGDILELPE